MKEPVKYRISLTMATLMVLFVLIVDIAEFILEWFAIGIITNIITTPIVLAILFFWFYLLGVSLISNWKLLIGITGTPVLEAVPFLDAIGGVFWTLGTIYLIIMIRAEDSGGSGLISKVAVAGATVATGGTAAVAKTGATVAAKAGASAAAKTAAQSGARAVTQASGEALKKTAGDSVKRTMSDATMSGVRKSVDMVDRFAQNQNRPQNQENIDEENEIME